ncbi:MAG TPA: TRAP transporter substrate-binding protein DctP [Bacteriovoracaceae bacterium]|nr:TRAP transporter substrate-binding protein DctP [Bacteriovoracaceae bacterium]
MLKTLLAFCLFAFASFSFAAQQVKLAVLVPEGTTWGNSLKKFSKEVEAVTKGEVTFKVYYGGVSGDEPDVVRKVRIGQLSGGIFTGKTLGDIHGDVRVMETPFTFFGDQKKASQTLETLTPDFNRLLKSKGFINLGFYEIGMVYVVSTKKVSNLNELKGVKIWSWEGDELVKAMLESLELVSVPLALPDVLSSLSTGIINAAYAPPLALLALQWHTKVKYLIDFPTAFSVGALLVSDKVWQKIKPEHQAQVQSIAAKFIKEANEKSISENVQAMEQLKKSGIEFVKFPDADTKAAASVREKVVKRLSGKLFSAEMAKKLETAAK